MGNTVKIIHQIWRNKNKPLPTFFSQLGEAWKENHTDWKYILWDDDMLESFILYEYPDYYENIKILNMTCNDGILYASLS